MIDGTEGARRPRNPRIARDERRAQVLRVARELFSTLGFHHVAMDDIAEAARVSKPVLYRHFPSKLDLYLAVVDEHGQELLTAVDDAVRPIEQGPVHRGQGRDVVAAVVRAYIDFADGAGESTTLLFESDVTRDADVRAHVERASVEAARRIATVLSQVTGLPEDATLLLAMSLVAMAEGAARYRLRHGAGVDAERTVALLTELAWGGVAGLVRPDYAYEDA